MFFFLLNCGNLFSKIIYLNNSYVGINIDSDGTLEKPFSELSKINFSLFNESEIFLILLNNINIISEISFPTNIKNFTFQLVFSFKLFFNIIIEVNKHSGKLKYLLRTKDHLF